MKDTQKRQDLANISRDLPSGLTADATPLPWNPIFVPLFLLMQTCFLMSVNVIGQRMDFYAMIHACWLIAVLYRRRRKAIAEIWPKYCCFLACIITFQYFICIGIPPAPCRGERLPPGASCSYPQPLQRGRSSEGQWTRVLILLSTTPLPADYPWRFKGASFNDNIIKWLYFPDFIVQPNPVFLVCKCCGPRAAGRCWCCCIC